MKNRSIDVNRLYKTLNEKRRNLLFLSAEGMVNKSTGLNMENDEQCYVVKLESGKKHFERIYHKIRRF